MKDDERALIVNGEACRLAAVTLAELVATRDLPLGGKGVAVALNREVVPRAAWPQTALKDGDRIEIIRVVVGG